MKPDFDYSTVPYGYVHCLNRQCQHATNCLRHQVALRASPDCTTFIVVNPSHVAPNGEECSYFAPDRLQQFALGITHLLDNVSYSNAVIIKKQMIDFFEKATYYRCWRRERLIKPDEQAYIRKLFLDKGITENPLFDEYVEQYEW